MTGEFPWMEELGGPQSTRLQRVGHAKRISLHFTYYFLRDSWLPQKVIFNIFHPIMSNREKLWSLSKGKWGGKCYSQMAQSKEILKISWHSRPSRLCSFRIARFRGTKENEPLNSSWACDKLGERIHTSILETAAYPQAPLHIMLTHFHRQTNIPQKTSESRQQSVRSLA